MEMKVNELRIGNLVEYNDCLAYVYSVESAEPRVNSNFNDKEIVTLQLNGLTTVTINEVQPIPLTEEWLLKFGFERLHQSNYILLENGSESFHLCETIFSYWVLEFKGLHWSRIQHVHQLQNLYQALTGEELTLKNQEK
jgi:hypothetical protein